MASTNSNFEQADAAIENNGDIDKSIKESSTAIQGIPQAAESAEPRTIKTTNKTTVDKNYQIR